MAKRIQKFIILSTFLSLFLSNLAFTGEGPLEAIMGDESLVPDGTKESEARRAAAELVDKLLKEKDPVAALKAKSKSIQEGLHPKQAGEDSGSLDIAAIAKAKGKGEDSVRMFERALEVIALNLSVQIEKSNLINLPQWKDLTSKLTLFSQMLSKQLLTDYSDVLVFSSHIHNHLQPEIEETCGTRLKSLGEATESTKRFLKGEDEAVGNLPDPKPSKEEQIFIAWMKKTETIRAQKQAKARETWLLSNDYLSYFEDFFGRNLEQLEKITPSDQKAFLEIQNYFNMMSAVAKLLSSSFLSEAKEWLAILNKETLETSYAYQKCAVAQSAALGLQVIVGGDPLLNRLLEAQPNFEGPEREDSRTEESKRYPVSKYPGKLTEVSGSDDGVDGVSEFADGPIRSKAAIIGEFPSEI